TGSFHNSEIKYFYYGICCRNFPICMRIKTYRPSIFYQYQFLMKTHDSNTVIKVAIADDHALFRTGVKTSLSSRKAIQMVAEAENGMQLPNLLRHIQPDVVLLVIQMRILEGLATLPEIKKLY